MRSLSRQRSSLRAFTLSLTYATALCTRPTSVARLTLTGTDTAINEDGFSGERKFGSPKSFAPPAAVPADTASYRESAVGAGEPYCSRPQARNFADALLPPPRPAAPWPRRPISAQSLPPALAAASPTAVHPTSVSASARPKDLPRATHWIGAENTRQSNLSFPG
jgi:hypothetical protein